MHVNLLKFERPELLYLLLLIPLFIILYILVNYLRKRAMRRFASDSMLEYLMPLRSKRRMWIKFILLLLGFASLITALANPQTGSKMETVKREGIDLFIALDVSNSMLAEDILPNRLQRAKQSISQLIDRLSGDRIGIVVFAGQAYIQLPLTTDYAAAKLFLSTINTNIVAAQGTAIGEAIQAALNAFDENERNKAIIIISDGEDHEENAIIASREAAAKGVYLYTIGMGLAEGAPIPIYNNYGKQTGYKKDQHNMTVITKLNEALLQQIASEGNGIYVRASNARVGLDAIFKNIDGIDKSLIETKVYTDYDNRFQLFIALALFLLIAEMVVASRKRKWEEKVNLFERRKS